MTYTVEQIAFTALESPFNVTFSGGDPFLQASELLAVCKLLKPYKNIWVYTGYTYEELMIDPIKRSVLDYIDVLVDGKYIAELNDGKQWFKGSSNQRIIDCRMSSMLRKVVLYEKSALY